MLGLVAILKVSSTLEGALALDPALIRPFLSLVAKYTQTTHSLLFELTK
jgi:hypothetical protein